MLPTISTRSTGLLIQLGSRSSANFLSLSSNITRFIFIEVGSLSQKECPSFTIILKGPKLLLSSFRLGLAVFQYLVFSHIQSSTLKSTSRLQAFTNLIILVQLLAIMSLASFQESQISQTLQRAQLEVSTGSQAVNFRVVQSNKVLALKPFRTLNGDTLMLLYGRVSCAQSIIGSSSDQLSWQ